MNTRKIVLYAALMMVVYLLMLAWQKDYPASASLPRQNQENVVSSEPILPVVKGEERAFVQEDKNHAKEALVHVTTDVLDIAISLQQGNVAGAKLLAYPVSVEEPHTPITLFTDEARDRYVANSNIFTAVQGQAENVDFQFTSEKAAYVLEQGQDSLTVILQGKSKTGLVAQKEFVFKKGSYLIGVKYLLQNQGNASWQGYWNTQLLRASPPEDASSLFHVGSYTGGSYSNPEKFQYKRLTFKEMGKENMQLEVKNGWIAMQQHYFLSAWIPPVGDTHTFYSRVLHNDYTIGVVSPLMTLLPQASKEIKTGLYVGPEDTSVLQEIAPGLDKTVDYGFLWFISALLFSLMKVIDAWVGNWGWTIVLVTLFIKLAFYRLSAKSYKSMASMRKLQPKLLALREKYGDDKAKLSQATMELYKQEKVNPLGGCLPILIQIPVFIALYWVLLESVELRQAPFIFWIKDLSASDPYHFLPIIMGITMLVQQRLNPAPPDPIQAKMMMFLPLLFTALFWNFPSGLVLYWIVNNTLSILQQWYITQKYTDTPKSVTR